MMTLFNTNIITANEAVAQIAYKTNEICAIYPITPASLMGELAEQWSAEGITNVLNDVPSVIEMQSEVGAAGTMHGALQTGTLATTFTASQGLLLMMPNMYRIAGELTPNVIHVATRSIATHALSVFSDHSDVMTVRNTGYAILGAATVQEAMDFALISQASSLKSRVPFVHYFDGFRTSHELVTIETVKDDCIKQMIGISMIEEHRRRALNPDNPVIRGTAQNSDTYFQSRERVNTYYDNCPEIVQETMNKFAELTGRQYQLFEYLGHPEATEIIIIMASAAETVKTSVRYLLEKGTKVGVVTVRLYRPFSVEFFLKAIPFTCTKIAVLDRTKEPGATGEPLYLDIIQSLTNQNHNHKFYQIPVVYGGRYGLSSKEFTPQMVNGIFEAMKNNKINHNFTIGINDDLTNLNVLYDSTINVPVHATQAIIVQKRNGTVQSLIRNIGTQLQPLFSNFQAYSECDYKKSNAISITHIRLYNSNIQALYLIDSADFLFCEDHSVLQGLQVLERLNNKALVIFMDVEDARQLQQQLTSEQLETIKNKKLKIYSYNRSLLKSDNTDFNMLYDSFSEVLSEIKMNRSGLENSKIKSLELDFDDKSFTTFKNQRSVAEHYYKLLAEGMGDLIPVSWFPEDGTYETGTSVYSDSRNSKYIPDWKYDDCTQCGLCVISCPQSAIRSKVFNHNYLKLLPKSFNYHRTCELDWNENLLNFTIQVNPDQCNGCNVCVDSCPVTALKLKSNEQNYEAHKNDWKLFEEIPEFDCTKLDMTKINQLQLKHPLFKYPNGVEGCGEAPYLRLISQLFGERMLVANATGSSSIFGGALPHTPWGKSKNGRGPAWSNSLFEDNAEFGFGFYLSQQKHYQKAIGLLRSLAQDSVIDKELTKAILNNKQDSEKLIQIQRNNIAELKKVLAKNNTEKALQLTKYADFLLQKSIWIVGGDGWAYDIGFGGLDHVVATGANVNILILDNETYDNTGGQMSKATPYGSSAVFAKKGKKRHKKDLGIMFSTYEDVYVASIHLGADPEQALKAMIEAENHDGPSVILAYCQSTSHGIDMSKPSHYHELVNQSGLWLLYRHDPGRIFKGLSPMQLDSSPPSVPVEECLKLQSRYKHLFYSNNNDIGIINEIQNQIYHRYYKYASLADQTGANSINSRIMMS